MLELQLCGSSHGFMELVLLHLEITGSCTRRPWGNFWLVSDSGEGMKIAHAHHDATHRTEPVATSDAY